ncbi:hypothetical protein [Halochromatium salexigens]|uniref:hypothetical protein n=1 Tax=Halochromatium salexigens TaxID=49447 RepID=UPI001913AB19|nr:hypothetical protein [Halochromatium salexigens]
MRVLLQDRPRLIGGSGAETFVDQPVALHVDILFEHKRHPGDWGLLQRLHDIVQLALR